MLKSVRVYFNTKRMSAILKALQNRTVNVELKSEVIEFGLVENIQKASDGSRKLTESLRDSNKSMNNADVAKKELEKEFEKVQKTLEKEQDKFFKLESRVDPMLTKMKDLLDKTKRAANELGVKPNNIDGFKELEQDVKELAKARVGK